MNDTIYHIIKSEQYNIKDDLRYAKNIPKYL